MAIAATKNNSKLLWSYELEGRDVGHLGAMPVELKAGEKKLRAAWAIDFLTLAEYRKKGIGTSLVSEANKNFDLFLAVGATDMSYSVFTKLGWRYLGEIPYFLKVWDLAPLVRKRIKNLFIANLISMPGNFLLGLFNYLKRPNKPSAVAVDIIDSFSQEADLLWNEISKNFRIVVSRNKAYLSQKYDQKPDMQYKRFRASRGNKACGYAVCRCIKTNTSSPEGLINDIIASCDDQDTIQALLLAALEYLRREGCSMARAYFTDKNIQRALSGCGFIRRNSSLRFLVNKNIEGLEELYNLDNWQITAGDSDIDREEK